MSFLELKKIWRKWFFFIQKGSNSAKGQGIWLSSQQTSTKPAALLGFAFERGEKNLKSKKKYILKSKNEKKAFFKPKFKCHLVFFHQCFFWCSKKNRFLRLSFIEFFFFFFFLKIVGTRLKKEDWVKETIFFSDEFVQSIRIDKKGFKNKKKSMKQQHFDHKIFNLTISTISLFYRYLLHFKAASAIVCSNNSLQNRRSIK